MVMETYAFGYTLNETVTNWLANTGETAPSDITRLLIVFRQ